MQCDGRSIESPLSGVAVYVITDPGVLCENRNTLLGIVDEVNQIGRGDLLGGVEHVLLKVHAELHPDVVAEAKIINSNRASDDSCTSDRARRKAVATASAATLLWCAVSSLVIGPRSKHLGIRRENACECPTL